MNSWFDLHGLPFGVICTFAPCYAFGLEVHPEPQDTATWLPVPFFSMKVFSQTEHLKLAGTVQSVALHAIYRQEDWLRT